MLIFILSLFFILYFIYVYMWIQSKLRREHSFDSPSPPEVLPHSVGLSIFFGILWGLTVVAGVFWGFIPKPYGNYYDVPGSTMQLIFLFIICGALGLSYVIIYHLGELRGVVEMKNTQLFITRMKK